MKNIRLCQRLEMSEDDNTTLLAAMTAMCDEPTNTSTLNNNILNNT